jgi:hypothetical protein
MYVKLGGLGYDNAFVNADWASPLSHPKLVVYSPHTGIKLSVHSPEPAIQIYVRVAVSLRFFSAASSTTAESAFFFTYQTCGGQKGTIPRKASQGEGMVEQYSCMVIEMEGVIDGELLRLSSAQCSSLIC